MCGSVDEQPDAGSVCRGGISSSDALRLCSLFFLSAEIIVLQLGLMRSLAVARYHHFSYLIISTALLGFGVSGVVLVLWYGRLRDSLRQLSVLCAGLFCCSIPVCTRIAHSLQLDMQYLLYNGTQLLVLALFLFLLFVPFFLGALAIGMMLLEHRKRITVYYGANLLGSGVGGILALGLMYLVAPEHLPAKTTILAWCAVFLLFLAATPRSPWSHLLVGAALFFSVHSLLTTPDSNIDQYKAISYLRRLEEQGDADHLASGHGPEGQIDVFSSQMMHQSLFVGLTAPVAPPHQLSLLFDGETSGAVFAIIDAGDAPILDYALQSVAYRLSASPDVLLLGESGGTSVWLAKRYDSRQIHVVQRNRQLLGIVREDLGDSGGHVFDGPEVTVVVQDPRLYVEQTDVRHDIIHVVAAEGMPSGTQGMYALHEDYLLTVESIAACIGLLTEAGLLTITRGMQYPPRDNIKIFAMCAAALRRLGVRKPGEHLCMIRNYLATSVLVSRSPFGSETLEALERIRSELLLDIDYAPGIQSDEIAQWNEVPGPPGTRYSYYHHAAMAILFGDREAFFDEWAYDITPPVDNKPYFHNFFRWKSLRSIFEAYGAEWFRRLEMGYVVLVATAIVVLAISLPLVLVPILVMRNRMRGGLATQGKWLPVVLYFSAIGFGFLFVEIVWMQKLTRLLGNPTYSTAAVLAAILIFAGAGSVLQVRVAGTPDPFRRIVGAAVVLAACLVVSLMLFDGLIELCVGWHLVLRFLMSMLLIMPVAFFMGWFFSSGISLLELGPGERVPLAWGVNGFTSVAASPAALLLAVSFGFRAVLVCAVVLYSIAGVAAFLMRGRESELSEGAR